MRIIDTVLKSIFFSNQPPVLIDIGASGEINSKWKLIAPYSICLAFDADDRDFQFSESTNSIYKKLITFNRIVTPQPTVKADFYLTSSPYCSSLLKPENEKLKPWVFKDFFNIEKVAALPAITLGQALQEAGIHYVDWFKSDSQGMDLQLFRSLPDNLSTEALAVEFEPGIIDAYEKEDMLFAIMEEMHNDHFWMSSMEVKGTQRLRSEYVQAMNSFVKRRILRNSPCWAEITYLRQPFVGNERQLLLLFVFAFVEKQFGFALEVADYALDQHDEPLFKECRKAVLKKIKAERLKTPVVFFKKQFNKLFASVHD